MAIRHASSGEPIDIQPLGVLLPKTQTHALFKSEQLELMRLVLPAGKSLPPHKVPGEITIQCIEGLIDVGISGKSHVLGPGQLLFLSGNVLHSVLALRDASALVTIVLQPPPA